MNNRCGSEEECRDDAILTFVVGGIIVTIGIVLICYFLCNCICRKPRSASTEEEQVEANKDKPIWNEKGELISDGKAKPGEVEMKEADPDGQAAEGQPGDEQPDQARV